jgi:hypothetical protein
LVKIKVQKQGIVIIQNNIEVVTMVDKRAQELGEFIVPLMGGGQFHPLETEDNIEVSNDPQEVIFTLDKIPGAPDAQEIIVEPEEEEEIEVEADPGETDAWKWEHASFLPWLSKMFSKVPPHSGYDTTGLEKAIAYFETLDREISKAMRTDFKDEIDAAQAERAREQIENGLERLLDRLESVKTDKYKRHKKKKSKGWAEDAGLVKEAQKSTHITGITITVPLLISRIARVCINGMVSAGHDIEDLFKRQVEEYDLTKREQAELSQLLSDMGYAMRQDRGYPVGTPVDTWRSDNYDWNANYFG